MAGTKEQGSGHQKRRQELQLAGQRGVERKHEARNRLVRERKDRSKKNERGTARGKQKGSGQR